MPKKQPSFELLEASKKQPSFEQLLNELEAAVQQLEAGNLTLDESLALYERGMQLAKECGERLDHAELRLTELAPAANDATAQELLDQDEEDDE